LQNNHKQRPPSKPKKRLMGQTLSKDKERENIKKLKIKK
jgi:hypothetical protein